MFWEIGGISLIKILVILQQHCWIYTQWNYEKIKPWHTSNKMSISTLIKQVNSFIQEIAYKMSEIITLYCLLTTIASYFQQLWKYRAASRPTGLTFSGTPWSLIGGIKFSSNSSFGHISQKIYAKVGERKSTENSWPHVGGCRNKDNKLLFFDK